MFDKRGNPVSYGDQRAIDALNQIDWSDDPYVARFIVRRDGHTLANVNATSLIDASVFVDESYCYQVSGYDTSGLLVAASDTACVTLLP